MPSNLSQSLRLLYKLTTIAFISIVSACQYSTPIVQAPTTRNLIQTHFQQNPHKKLIPKVQPQTKSQPQTLLPAKLHQIKHRGIQFNIITFDTRNQHLIVADQPKGPGSIWADAEAAAKANHGIAAINAGFFTPEGKPLGIVISNGIKAGANHSSSLGTGMFYHTPTGASISRRAIWKKLSAKPPKHLLQSGPMLLENSKSIAGLSNKNSRVRSLIATDGKNHWCIGHAESCTLSQLSEALSSLKISDFKPTTALNLDGGRSSDLWISTSVHGGSKTIRPFWNKSVRNFLILKNN